MALAQIDKAVFAAQEVLEMDLLNALAQLADPVLEVP